MFDAVLTGAGISFDPPSLLPSAAELSEEVWGSVRESLTGIVSDALDAKVRKALPTLRMEQFLELLSKKRTIPIGIIVDVYRLVAGAAFNENHLRLASLKTKHFTVNMDTLIEDAQSGVKVTHLHGTWNEPQKIRTTVAHYSEGLSAPLARQFGEAIENATVLVIGYSGRDTDVMPLFDRYPPRRLVWVGPNPASWEYEVLQLKGRYMQGDFGKGRRFESISETASEYLPTLVPSIPRPSGVTVTYPRPQLAARLLRETEIDERVLAAGNLLFDLGLYRELRELVEHRRFHRSTHLMAGRKLLARSLAREGDARAALEVLRQPPTRLLEIGPWLQNATEIDALLPRATVAGSTRLFWQGALRLLNAIPLPMFRRSRMLARIRRAKRMAIVGRVEDAVALARRVTHSRHARATLSYDLLVDSLTWEADALKSIGALNEALESAVQANRLGFYGNPSQAAFAKWKVGEILAASGRPGTADAAKHYEAVLALFAEAIKLAKQAGNADTLAWVHGTYAEVVAPDNLSAARMHLRIAERLGALSPCRSEFGRAYHLLQRAVVDLIGGELDSAERNAEESIALAGTKVPVARLQAQQLLHELNWRRDGSYDLAGHLLSLADDYHRLGMTLNESRARVAAAVLQGRAVETWILSDAKAKGWNDLTRRAAGADGPYPWRRDILL